MSDLDDSFRPIAEAPTSTVSALQTRHRHYLQCLGLTDTPYPPPERILINCSAVFGKGSAFFLSITPSTAAAGHRSLGIGSAFVPLVLQAMAVDAEHKLHELDKPFGVAVLQTVADSPEQFRQNMEKQTPEDFSTGEALNDLLSIVIQHERR